MPQPGEKQPLGTLSKVNPGIAGNLKKSTGVDASNADVVVDPKLQEMRKRGVARDGTKIGVVSLELVKDDKLID